ncbi:uncharacterized protein LOC125088902 [Lutra lutra]|uniref:uncharacterized protein LOC125088902 n=1 Tax=Lutra lutra TaxID=9657 RepID=UPI001FD1562F|nr:uncharacterized protein LOC125088902 [Lutra lutra]
MTQRASKISQMTLFLHLLGSSTPSGLRLLSPARSETPCIGTSLLSRLPFSVQHPTPPAQHNSARRCLSVCPRSGPVPPPLRPSHGSLWPSEERLGASPVCEPPRLSLQVVRPYVCPRPSSASHIKAHLLGRPLPGLDRPALAQRSIHLSWDHRVLLLFSTSPDGPSLLLACACNTCLRDSIFHGCAVSVEEQRKRRGSQPSPSGFLCPVVLETLVRTTTLQVQEGRSLHLVCDTGGNFPARLSWCWGSLTLSPSQPTNPRVLVLPQLVLGDGGEFPCQAQYLWSSYHVCANLAVQDEYTWDTCILR